MQISADEVKNKVIQGMVDNLYNKDYADNPEDIFKLIIAHIEQKLNYKYDYSSIEILMKNMRDTIVMAILNIKAPEEKEKMKFYSSLLSIEDWFVDLDTFERKMQEMYLLKTNIIKRVCYELGLTYKQLGEAIGLSEGSIKRLATSDEINTQAVKSCEMLLEIKNLKEQLSNTETLKTALKTLLD